MSRLGYGHPSRSTSARHADGAVSVPAGYGRCESHVRSYAELETQPALDIEALGDFVRRVGWKLFPSVRHVVQPSPFSCAAAALAMVLGAHRRSASVEVLRAELGEGPEGASADAVLRVAEAHGLKPTILECCDPIELSSVSGPLLLPWGGGHFVVVARRTRSMIEVLDPAYTTVVMTPSQVAVRWHSIAIAFDP